MFAQLKRYYSMVDGEIYIGLDLHILIEFSFNYKILLRYFLKKIL